MSAKLNWLSRNTVPGTVILQSWLTKHDFSPQLAQKYVKNGSLNKLRSGVYVRPGREPKWFNALNCLIEQLDFPIHLAGLTSLSHQGKAHYLQLNETTVWLEIPPRRVLPLWFRAFPSYLEHPDSVSENNTVTGSLLLTNSKNPDWLLITSNKLNTADSPYLIDIDVGGTKLKASNPELAAFELLGATPNKILFEHAAEVFQGLTNLSPKKVQALLESSNSIKTNRLYLFLAHFYQHPWFSRIDVSQINLGSGKRQIVIDGGLDPQYQITVPKTFL